MLKKTIQFHDFNDEPCEETVYFNLTEAETIRLDVKFGGLENYIGRLSGEADGTSIMDLLEELLGASYGEKSEDGKHFVKTPEMREQFLQSAVFSALFVHLLQNEDEAASFFVEVLSKTTPGKTKAQALKEAEAESLKDSEAKALVVRKNEESRD